MHDVDAVARQQLDDRAPDPPMAQQAKPAAPKAGTQAEAAVQALQDPTIRDRLTNEGQFLQGGTPARFVSAITGA